MRRVAHHLFTIVAALSLLLSVATTVMWAASIGHVSSTFLTGPAHELHVSSIDGVFGIAFARDSVSRPPIKEGDRRYGWMPQRRPLDRDRASYIVPSFNRWGFGAYLRKTVGSPVGSWRIGGRSLFIAYVPYWLLMSALAIPSVLWLYRWIRRRHRKIEGLCPVCGYDLRATPDRCPECGTAVPHANAET